MFDADEADEPGRGAAGRDDVTMLDIGGEPVEYYPRGAEIAPIRAAALQGYDYRKDALLIDRPRCRRAVVRLRFATDVTRMFGALHWVDERDAALLDELTTAGVELADPDLLALTLDAALFCSVASVTCRNCHSSSTVLVVEPSAPVSSIPRRRSHPTSHRCPVCDDDRFISHYEVLE